MRGSSAGRPIRRMEVSLAVMPCSCRDGSARERYGREDDQCWRAVSRVEQGLDADATRGDHLDVCVTEAVRRGGAQDLRLEASFRDGQRQANRPERAPKTVEVVGQPEDLPVAREHRVEHAVTVEKAVVEDRDGRGLALDEVSVQGNETTPLAFGDRLASR